MTTYTFINLTPRNIKAGMHVVFHIKDVPYTETYYQPCLVEQIRKVKHTDGTKYQVDIVHPFTGERLVRYVSPHIKLKVQKEVES